MKRAASPRNETTRLSALAIGFRLIITAAPNTSINNAKIQNRNGDMNNCSTDRELRRERRLGIDNWQSRSLFLIPFQHHSVHHPADLEEFLFVMHHVSAGEAGNGVILAQEDRLFRAYLLAHAAENAADHVDIEFLGIFLNLGEAICGRDFARDNFDRAWRTNEFAELAGDTTHAPVHIPHKRRGASIMVR